MSNENSNETVTEEAADTPAQPDPIAQAIWLATFNADAQKRLTDGVEPILAGNIVNQAPGGILTFDNSPTFVKYAKADPVGQAIWLSFHSDDAHDALLDLANSIVTADGAAGAGKTPPTQATVFFYVNGYTYSK